MPNDKAKVFICIPNLGNIHSLLAQRLIEWSTIPTPGVDQVAVYMPRNLQPHDSARNACVKKFLTTDFTHLFFIDSDVVPPSHALEKLLSLGVPAISGAYPIMRKSPVTDKLYRCSAIFNLQDVGDGVKGMMPIDDQDTHPDGVVKIDFCGGGCLLIRRDVLEIMKAPWFKWMYNEDGVAAYGEDIDFCKKLTEIGVQLYGDFDVQCYHYKDVLL